MNSKQSNPNLTPRTNDSDPNTAKQNDGVIETDAGLACTDGSCDEYHGRTIPAMESVAAQNYSETLSSIIEQDSEWDRIEDYFNHSEPENCTDLFHKVMFDEEDGEEDESVVKSFIAPTERTKTHRVRLLDDDPITTISHQEKSDSFDIQLNSTTADAQNHKASESTENTQDNQIIKHFEGTNEIFIHSKVFEAICDTPENSSAPQRTQPKTDLKIPAEFSQKSLTLTSSRLQSVKSTDDSNVFGIVSSGILPNVDIDKSFDTPCIEEDSLNSEQSVEDDEVFVSRLSIAQNRTGSQPGKNSFLPPKNEILPQNPAGVKSSFGLPLPQKTTVSHPDDTLTEQAPLESFNRFAIAHLFDTRAFELLNRDIENLGLQEDLERMFDCTQGMNTAETPKLVYVRSDQPFERNRLTHAFLKECSCSLTNCHCYTSATNNNPQQGDLVTALVSSRIACFPESEEEERINCIIKGADLIFPQSDLHWGKDILFVRYQLNKCVFAKKDLPFLVSRNKIDLLEALLSMIEYDATTGPVIISISDEWIKCGHVWKDVIRKIQTLESANILVLVVTSKQTDILQNAEIIDASEYSLNDVREIFCTALQDHKLTTQTIDACVKNAGTTFTEIRHSLRIIDQAVTTSTPITLPKDKPEHLNAFLQTFSDDEKKFLSTASLLNEYFYFDDIVRVLSIEALDNEVAWFTEKRREWCQTVAARLVNQGELIPITSNNAAPGTCYIIPERQTFRNYIAQTDPEFKRKIIGTYAMVLEQRNASALQQATAFEEAGLWNKAAQAWLNIAQRHITNFYNQSANEILRHCLPHIGPEFAVIYKVLLMQCIRQNIRMGQYELACTHADLLARYAYILNDALTSSTAFIAKGDALRMQGKYTEAQNILQYALNLAEKTDKQTKIADAYYALAKLTFDAGLKGALVNALRYAEKSLETRRKSGDLPKLAETQTLCASIYLLRGEPQRAEQAANEAYRALNASGHWYDTPYPLTLIAEAESVLGKPLPLDPIDRGFEIANKTGDIEQQFNLLLVRIKLMINTLQKQAVRDDLDAMQKIISKWPLLPWITQYQLLNAQFDFSRKNFQKTTKSLKLFFDSASKLGNSYLLSIGYALSAELNFEVYKRELGNISIEKTNKLYHTATTIYESLGAWHKVAETQRQYAKFLDFTNRPEDAEKQRLRADKVDPYCQ